MAGLQRAAAAVRHGLGLRCWHRRQAEWCGCAAVCVLLIFRCAVAVFFDVCFQQMADAHFVEEWSGWSLIGLVTNLDGSAGAHGGSCPHILTVSERLPGRSGGALGRVHAGQPEPRRWQLPRLQARRRLVLAREHPKQHGPRVDAAQTAVVARLLGKHVATATQHDSSRNGRCRTRCARPTSTRRSTMRCSAQSPTTRTL